MPMFHPVYILDSPYSHKIELLFDKEILGTSLLFKIPVVVKDLAFLWEIILISLPLDCWKDAIIRLYIIWLTRGCFIAPTSIASIAVTLLTIFCNLVISYHPTFPVLCHVGRNCEAMQTLELKGFRSLSPQTEEDLCLTLNSWGSQSLNPQIKMAPNLRKKMGCLPPHLNTTRWSNKPE